MAEYEIKTEKLVKQYKLGENTICALNEVDINIICGSFVSVTGKSGSGKSTLLHMLGGIDKPTSGTVFLADKELTKLKDAQLADLRRDYIGFVFQKFCLVKDVVLY